MWGSLRFQNLLSTTSSSLERFHDLVIVWLLVVLLLVILVSYKTVVRTKGRLLIDREILEVAWTVIPIIILISVAYPSILLLCLQDFFKYSPISTTKIVSNQWNWQRDGGVVNDHLLDSEELDIGSSFEIPVLLTDNTFRVVIVRTDVLHSLGVPSLGLKLDATPGRINTTLLEIELPGVVLGSCYELCGSGRDRKSVV